jgi:hypothetical protein
MGRFDLSRRWFETALASSPDNAAVLTHLADSLQRQGKLSEAAAVQAEVAKLAAPERAPSAKLDSTPVLALDEVASSVTIPLPPPAPPQPTTRVSERAPAVRIGSADPVRAAPHLERLSLGEVALITRPGPVWAGQLVESSPTSATFRWVEVRPVARLLNAARVEGLAARTRRTLVARGWKGVAIGDAPAVRSTTLVLYPEYRRKMALKLAAQFGFRHLQSFSGSEIVVLLGRDAVGSKDPQAA